MAKHLSDEQVRRYHDDGFLFPVEVFSPEVAAAYRARMEALEAVHGAMKYAMATAPDNVLLELFETAEMASP